MWKVKGVLLFQDPKLLMELESRGSGSVEQRTVTVCSGLDLFNITYNNFVAADEKRATVCMTVASSSPLLLYQCQIVAASSKMCVYIST